MANSVGIKALVKELNALKSEKLVFIQQIDKQITEMESCIDLLAGKKVWEVEKEEVFDDENPDYIKGSIEN